MSRTQVAIASGLAAAIRAGITAPKPFRFRGGPAEAQRTTAREWLLEGPADTTKTTAGLWRLDSDLRATPKARAVIAMRIRANMGTTVLSTWERILARRGGVTKYGGEDPRWFDYPNGARAYVAGLDDGDKVLGGEFDFVYASQLEQWPLDSFEKLTSRVTGRGAVAARPWVGADANPGHPSHWILKRPGLLILHARHEDNPELFDDNGNPTVAYADRIAPLDALTGVRKERLRFGRWVAAEGVVYEEFDRAIHVLPVGSPMPPPEWRRLRSIDFGYTNPFVCQWWAVDPDGRLYLYREIYRTQMLVEDAGREIIRLSEGERIEATVADHDAGDRATLARLGISTVPAQKAVDLGIQAVRARLKVAGDKKPRLYIYEAATVGRDEALVKARKPTSTLEEEEVYRYPQGADGRPLKEEPVKENDHGQDAKRYLVAHIDGLGIAKGSGWLELARRAAEAKKARERAA